MLIFGYLGQKQDDENRTQITQIKRAKKIILIFLEDFCEKMWGIVGNFVNLLTNNKIYKYTYAFHR